MPFHQVGSIPNGFRLLYQTHGKRVVSVYRLNHHARVKRCYPSLLIRHYRRNSRQKCHITFSHSALDKLFCSCLWASFVSAITINPEVDISSLWTISGPVAWGRFGACANTLSLQFLCRARIKTRRVYSQSPSHRLGRGWLRFCLRRVGKQRVVIDHESFEHMPQE